MRSEQDMLAKQNKLKNKIHQLTRQLTKLPKHGERRRILEREIEVMEIEAQVLKWMTWDPAYRVKLISEELAKKRKELFS